MPYVLNYFDNMLKFCFSKTQDHMLVRDNHNPQEYDNIEGDDCLQDNLEKFVNPERGDNCLTQSTDMIIKEILKEIVSSVVSSSHIDRSFKGDNQDKENMPPRGKQTLPRPEARQILGILRPSSNVSYIPLDIQGQKKPNQRTSLLVSDFISALIIVSFLVCNSTILLKLNFVLSDLVNNVYCRSPFLMKTIEGRKLCSAPRAMMTMKTETCLFSERLQTQWDMLYNSSRYGVDQIEH
jgi:hypothetical protein